MEMPLPDAAVIARRFEPSGELLVIPRLMAAYARKGRRRGKTPSGKE